MKLTLRPYQERGIEAFDAARVEGHERILIVAPTGSGKTAWAARLIELFVRAGLRCLFLAHRKELIDQISAMLDFMGIPHGVIQGNHHRRRPDEPVQVASVQTLTALALCLSCKNKDELRDTCNVCDGVGKQRSRKLPPADLVVGDEFHRVLAEGYQKLLANYPQATLAALTATPWRLDGRGLGRVFSKMLVLAEMHELIEQGYLVPFRIFGPRGGVDLSGVKVSHGDYQSDELSTVMRNSKLEGNVVAHILQHANGLRTLVFSTSVEHSQDIVRRCKEAGMTAEHLDGSTPKAQREAILARFASGATQIVSNCDVIAEGYDLPSIGCVVLARPTLSLTRYLQQVGRGSRPAEGKSECIILDHANCVRNLGLPHERRDWSLEDRIQKRPKVELPPSQCPKCGMYFEGRSCPGCTATQLQLLASVPEETDEELVEYTSGPPAPLDDATAKRGMEAALAQRPPGLRDRREQASKPRRRSDVILCSRCGAVCSHIRRSTNASIKVTCGKCVQETERAR